MKTVLILAYDFPPYVSVAGLRPKSWFDELHKHGYYPIVITRQWSNKHKSPLDYVEKSDSLEVIVEEFNHGKIIRTPYKPNVSNRLLLKHGQNKFRILRKGITAFYEFTQFFLPVGPKSKLFHEAKKFLSNHNVNVIIATGEPFVLFNYAKKLSRKYRTPWIADYRDVWSEIHEKRKNPLIQYFHRFNEKRITTKATSITTVSSFVKEKIIKITRHKNIHVLTNGYNSKSMENASKVKQKSDVLRIAMAGSILAWNPTESFLKAIEIFHTSYPDKKIEFHFFGLNIQNEFESLLKLKFSSIESLFTLHPKVSNTKLHLKLAEVNALLLFNNFSFMGTKIYDYLGLERKILFCFTDDEEGNIVKRENFPIGESEKESDRLQEELILKTNSGIPVKDQKHLVEILIDLQAELHEKGTITCESKNIKDYSRDIQAKRLAEIISEIESK